MTKHKLIVNGFRGLVTTGLVSLLVACGGGGGGSSGDNSSVSSESIVARGVITQLGSIWVLGVEYETPNGGTYSDDDNVISVANYKVGQWVRVRGRRNVDGISGTASEVEYEAEIEGAAAGGAINGVTIIFTPSTNTAEAGNITALNTGNRYEVSGLWLNDSSIEATYIKDDDDGDGIDEIKGFVEAVNPGLSLTVRGVTYSYGGPTVVAVGDLVEIHFNGTTASRVELEDDFNDRDDGQEVEFEGAVNLDPADLANCATGADFLIDATCIDWDSMPSSGWQDGLTGPGDMESGLRVEAEGHFNASGLLIAEKIKGRGNRVRITSTATNVNGGAGTFDLFFGDIQVTTMSGVTEYDLDAGSGVSDINNGDGLEVRGIRTGPASMLAQRIKSESVNANRHELRAEVDLDGADAATNSITVMGISSVADSDTELEIENTVIATGSGSTTEADIDAFLNMIDDDNIVNSSNGPQDIVDVRIDTTNGGDGSFGDPYLADQIEIEEEDD
jgi:hypothetical protein